MSFTYAAGKRIKVGDRIVEVGEPVPEAEGWDPRSRTAMVNVGQLVITGSKPDAPVDETPSPTPTPPAPSPTPSPTPAPTPAPAPTPPSAEVKPKPKPRQRKTRPKAKAGVS